MKMKNNDQAMNFYNSVNDTKPSKQISLSELYQTVKNGTNGIKDIVTEVRKYDKSNADDKKIINKLKSVLPAVHIPMGGKNPTKTLTNISKDALSGFVYFDIDNIQNLKEVKKELSNSSKISMVWFSASGTGLGVIVECDWVGDLINFKSDLNEQYQQITKYLWNVMGFGHIEIDPKANRINQVNYISYDIDAHYNQNADCEVVKPDNLIIKTTSQENNASARPNKNQTTIQKPTTQLNNTLTKDILDDLVMQIECDEKDNKVWISSASGTSAINLLTARAVQYGIEPKDVLIYMQQYTIHSDKDKVFDLKAAESWSRGALYSANFKKQLYNYSPILNSDAIMLKQNQYLADVFDYKLFKSEGSNNVKAVIIASTGMGKNYAIVQNSIKNKTIIVVPYNSLVDSVIKDAQSINYSITKQQILDREKFDLEKGFNIFAPLSEAAMKIEVEKINKTNAPIKFVRFDQYATDEEKTIALSSNNLIITTNESLPRVVEQLKKETNNTEFLNEYLLVVDEVHIYSYSKWRENAYTRAKPITDVLDIIGEFANVIAMTGTYSDNPIKAFENFKVVKFKYEVEPIVRSFGYVKRGDGKVVDEDLKIVNYFKKQGYFPIIYKNDKKQDGWLGDIKKTAKSTYDWNFGDVNSDSKIKTPEYYKDVVIDRNIDKSKYDGIIITSIMKQGVSTNIKINKGDENKVVYIINASSNFGGIDSDEIQQIANRVRNATEVCICLVYPHSTKIISINHNLSKFDYFYTLGNLKTGQLNKNEEYNKDGVADLAYGQRKIFQKFELKNFSRDVNGKFEISDLYLAQELAATKSIKEFCSPVYMGWLGFEKFGWNYLGLLNLNIDLILCDHSEHQAIAKEIKFQKAVDFSDGIDFVCTMFEEVYKNTDISEFNKFLNNILKGGKLEDGSEVGDGFKKAVLVAMSVQSKFKNLVDYKVVKDLITTMTNNKVSSKVLDMLNVYIIYKDLNLKVELTTNREKLYAKCFEAIENFEIPVDLFVNRLEAINSLNLIEFVELYPIIETNTDAKKSKFVELLVVSFFEICEKGKNKITRKNTYKMTRIDLYDLFILNGF